MERVAIIGPGGAGKTTLAERLGHLTGLAVVHLDQHFWRPGWVPTPREEWRAWQLEHLPGDGRWIADGNYGGTLEVRLARADTVVLLNPGRLTRTARCLRRTIGSWGVPVQAAGCPERLDLRFLRWVWRYDQDARPRVDSAIERFGQHTRVHELVSDDDVDGFLASVQLS